MGLQEGYVVTRRMSRCQVCSTHTFLTKEIFLRSGKHETLSMCYNCQKNNEDLPRRPPQYLRIIPSMCAAGQKPLEKWITMH